MPCRLGCDARDAGSAGGALDSAASFRVVESGMGAGRGDDACELGDTDRCGADMNLADAICGFGEGSGHGFGDVGVSVGSENATRLPGGQGVRVYVRVPC